MGNSYSNFIAKTDDQAAVVNALRSLGIGAAVTPQEQGFVVIFDEPSERSGTHTIEPTGNALSLALRVPVLAVLIHDDDAMWYWLFRNGAVADTYSSNPGAFDKRTPDERGGDEAVLTDAFGVPEA